MTKIIDGIKLDFNDVLIEPKFSPHASRKEVDIERNFFFYHSPIEWKGTPIIAANMNTTGTYTMANALAKYNICTALSKHYDNDKILKKVKNWDYTFYTIGIKDKDFDKLNDFIDKYREPPKLICVDVANGYTDDFIEAVAKVRTIAKDSVIMAGNIATPNIVSSLIKQGGADIVKVGIGSGSSCLTRPVTGVGYPQLSAIMECADVAHGLNTGPYRLGLVCADGGITNSGDICKALGGGADFLMIGGLLAGTDECEGKWEYEWQNGIGGTWTPICHAFSEHPSRKKNFIFYGMSSSKAQKKFGVKESYRASEGRVVKIPYKGLVSKVIQEITGGIRSCCAYIGAKSIRDMNKCTTFVRVNNTHNKIYEKETIG